MIVSMSSSIDFSVATTKNLRELENRSVYIIREAFSQIPKLGMLWSIGKDSTVLLWLVRKAFAGQIPFPIIHIDTHFKIPSMIEYRDYLAKKWNFELIVSENKEALERKQTFPDGNCSRIECCKNLKTQGLKQVIEQYQFKGILAGIRADEEGSRSKERYFSPRSDLHQWKIGESPPEFWSQFQTEVPEGAHLRVHPLLDWTETNIWEYIHQEQIPMIPLYFNQGQNLRYRSIGCAPCTKPITSAASNVSEIIRELQIGQLANVAERSGRSQDKEGGGTLEDLRRHGYM